MKCKIMKEQKPPSQDVLWKKISKKSCKIHSKTLVMEPNFKTNSQLRQDYIFEDYESSPIKETTTSAK